MGGGGRLNRPCVSSGSCALVVSPSRAPWLISGGVGSVTLALRASRVDAGAPRALRRLLREARFFGSFSGSCGDAPLEVWAVASWPAPYRGARVPL